MRAAKTACLLTLLLCLALQLTACLEPREAPPATWPPTAPATTQPPAEPAGWALYRPIVEEHIRNMDAIADERIEGMEALREAGLSLAGIDALVVRPGQGGNSLLVIRYVVSGHMEDYSPLYFLYRPSGEGELPNLPRVVTGDWDYGQLSESAVLYSYEKGGQTHFAAVELRFWRESDNGFSLLELDPQTLEVTGTLLEAELPDAFNDAGYEDFPIALRAARVLFDEKLEPFLSAESIELKPLRVEGARRIQPGTAWAELPAGVLS
ncbi:MAG: hypothetical protein LBD02_09070 [Christensenellaceae bacterium]|jgi:hypothetical protein|nr:hypothetical protein [Christensenellaceae bacterium]